MPEKWYLGLDRSPSLDTRAEPTPAGTVVMVSGGRKAGAALTEVTLVSKGKIVSGLTLTLTRVLSRLFMIGWVESQLRVGLLLYRELSIDSGAIFRPGGVPA